MSERPNVATDTGRAPIRFPPELPISARVSDIVAALTDHQVVIVAGATGSGKTTQLPKVALQMGRGGRRRIGVTQPRRIAATSVAARVARELECELGNEVGYQVRFENRVSRNTWVKFMTDGVLLAELQSDRLLLAYDTIIVDEAHERSLNIDFVLGWIRRILPERRDLKVVISSATIETARFSEFFDNAPVIQVEGRTYPVDVLYEPPDPELDFAEAVADAVQNITSLDPRGDVLVFLPGEREIREAELAILDRKLRLTQVQPLYARLSSADQAKVFAPISERRIILATNVAETSLTIPGIVYVIDTGTARLSRYDPRTGTTRLQIEAISQASADQRKGRCGRVREGICVRLYDQQNFDSRPAFTDPEMKRTGLASVILRMKSLGLGNVEDFPFLDPPKGTAIAEGYRVLQELSALDDSRELTDLGKRLARFPVDPRVARMIVAGADLGCLPEILVVAAALNLQDPRERPREHEAKASQLHQRFRDDRSDFLGLLRLWKFIRDEEKKGKSQLRRTCRENFLSYTRVREWTELHRELCDLVRDLKLGEAKSPSDGKATEIRTDPGDPLHLALLSGLLSRVGQYHPEQRVYVGAKQTRFALHPSSGLAKKPPPWTMAFELVQTTQLFARTVAKIDPLWLAKVGSHQLKRSYSDPHWSEKSARSSVKEHSTLFGLTVLKDHSVDYATIAPEQARRMFIEHALVRGEYKSRGAFQAHNRALFDELARLRDKARQSDMLADEAQLYDFFDQRIPDSVMNGKTFEAFREASEKTQPKLLFLRYSDVISQDEQLRPEDYPDTLTIYGTTLALSYRFDPYADDDGVTVSVPLALLPQLGNGELDFTIPAWQTEKVAALLEQLPRTVKRDFLNPRALAEALAPKLAAAKGPLLPALSRMLSEQVGVQVNPDAFRVDSLPAHLNFNCRIIGEKGDLVAEGRDIPALIRQHGARARELLRAFDVEARFERKGIVAWDFGDLPPYVTRRIHGSELRSYPTLVDRQTSVDITLFESVDAAENSLRKGVARLLALALRGPLGLFGRRIPPPFPRRSPLPVSRSEQDAFGDALLLRVVEESFRLNHDRALPRNKAAFEQLLAEGSPTLPHMFDLVTRGLQATASEYAKLQQALAAAAKHPSGNAVGSDIRAQLELLLPIDLIGQVELSRLEDLPRYLKAAQARLARALVDPTKDKLKAEPFSPLWKSFLSKSEGALDRSEVRRLRWTFEELRVALFAPELKPRGTATLACVSAALNALR